MLKITETALRILKKIGRDTNKQEYLFAEKWREMSVCEKPKMSSSWL